MTPTNVTYAQYLALRAEHAYHPLLRRSVSEIKHEFDRVRSGRVAAYEAEKAALAFRFDYPYGGYVSDFALDAEKVRALGFDPEHLTAKVECAYDDFFETAEGQAKEAGFEVEKANGGEYRYEWHHEDGDRPSHEAVKVDYSGPRDRSDYRWVTLKPSEAKYFLSGNAWAGMSRGVKAQVRHERLLGAAESMADYMRKWCADDIKNFHVCVTVYWRGEEVGSASLGGNEVDTGKRPRDMADEFADFLLGNGLIDEALDEAAKWADDAVTDAQKRAASIVEGIALLPQRSIDAVRDSFTTATITKARRA